MASASGAAVSAPSPVGVCRIDWAPIGCGPRRAGPARRRRATCGAPPLPFAVYVAAVADANHHNAEPVILNLCNDAVIANPVFPQISEPEPSQCLTDAPRIFQPGNALE